MRRVALILSLLVFASAALLVGISSCGGEPPYQGPPVLVIGVDGLEWNVMEPLLTQGRMPNTQALIERGVAGLLKTEPPAFSPVVWTSIATGVPQAKHGIHYFSEVKIHPNGVIQPLPSEVALPYTSNCRKVPAIWNVAGAGNRSVLSVAWWVSWPAEVVENARIVASYAAQVQGQMLWKPGAWPDGFPNLTYPESLQSEMKAILQEGAPGGPLSEEYVARYGMVPNKDKHWQYEANRDSLFHVAYRGDRTHVKIMLAQLRQEVADLNMVYIGLPDVAGHSFWRYFEPGAYKYKIGAKKIDRLGQHLEMSYEDVDRWIGELVAAVPSETRIMVLSDHGMHAGNVGAKDAPQNGMHMDGPPGIFIAAGPGIVRKGVLPRGQHIGNIYDVMPTLLDWLNLPVAEDLSGESLREYMDEEWKLDHTLRKIASHAKGFRAATAPRAPSVDANEIFTDGLMDQLGYAGIDPGDIHSDILSGDDEAESPGDDDEDTRPQDRGSSGPQREHPH